MSVLAVGLSHRSSPVALLERVALSGEARLKAMSEMAGADAVNEVMMVATCNRVEIYADVDKFHPGVAALSELLSWHTGVALAELTRHLYVHYEERAVQHLFSVACGLDSMVVGEGQILGQVRAALKEAQQSGTLGRVLNDLGQRALRVGKRAHTETHLDHAGADMVSLGLLVAGRHLPAAAARPAAPAEADAACPHVPAGAGGADGVAAALPRPQALAGQRVLVLGAGSMSALSANTVARQGASSVVVANRTFERAARLAECLTEAYEPLRSRAAAFDRAADELAGADLVISCTGAQGLVLTRDDVAAAVARRGGRPLVLLDLALPRDVDPGVRDLPGAVLVDIEDLRQATAEGTGDVAGTAADISAVREIVEEEVAGYQAVRRAELVAPTVVALRSKAQTVVDTELSRLHGRLPDLDDRARGEIDHAVRRVVDKLLHQPTVRVKQLASAPNGGSYEAALRELFDLDPHKPDAVTLIDPATAEEG
ncbi:glutamyl-tRNA reductase [Marinitenerispora sediminis]|uniref:Glutamyl-tRNA reductase n=1 Tax=Marinitenerispora sediminis TaxID=1931232 RepID=A0A368T6T1_9ACTN|nr:glutamyl-tRNA reductase [Marinitenerispora sediminis]RCV50868.1 glutamyl-tRNA reductase [Marinitenerispora sediminis]RCV56479.1 glutamyl-tRNA reductase [Marinitenerispora sediminis]RCV59562.1 glutamyl-tRNA reductase [Marinitenerispora sediminis]